MKAKPHAVAAAKGKAAPVEKAALHPRNAHRGRYDFQQLIAASPELAAFVVLNEYADESVDFANPAAVKALNRALLKQVYGIQAWDIPSQYLCPPIPGRADYVHLLADLLATVNGGVVPRGEAVRVLDIGTGANCIYPLIGQRVYGWQFVGSDIDATALANAQRIVDANHLGVAINLRLQSAATSIFKGVLQAHEQFDLTLCNPPFHGSLAEAAAGSQRKWNNLRRESGKAPVLNFGGQGAELFCAGGEAGFVRRMIAESAQLRGNCLWFSTLVSKADNLPTVYRALKQAGVLQHKTMDMAQGQKKSRLVAWTFLDDKQQQAWRMARWA